MISTLPNSMLPMQRNEVHAGSMKGQHRHPYPKDIRRMKGNITY